MTSSSAGGLLRRRCPPSPPHGVASKLFAPKGRTPWAFTPIYVMGRPWRLLCVWGLSPGVIFGWTVVVC